MPPSRSQEKKPAGASSRKSIGRLQLLNDLFLSLALLSNADYAPEAGPCAGRRQRPHADLVPPGARLAAERLAEAQLLDMRLAAARGLGEPVDGLRHVRPAANQTFERTQVRRVTGARHRI